MRAIVMAMSVGALALGCGDDGGGGHDGGGGGDAPLPNEMTFRVSVPANTPAEDSIYLFSSNQQNYRLSEVAPGVHEVIVPVNIEGLSFSYRYTRNGMDFISSEAIAPDTNAGFFANPGRSVTLVAGATQTDVVARWRWFPDVGRGPAAPALPAPVALIGRDGGRRFEFGTSIQDFYTSAFDVMFVPAAVHQKAVGYRTAALEPAWQVLATDPLPIVGNDLANNPNYPDDKLRAHIRSLDAQGLDVLVRPQLYPHLGDESARPAIWWDAWFQTYGDALVAFARIAAEEGAATFAFYPEGQHPIAPPDADNRWRAVIARVRAVFPGQVGLSLIAFSGVGGQQYVIPDPSNVPALDAFDFLTFDSFGAVSLALNPTDADLVAGAGALLDQVAVLGASKPVIVAPGYAAVAGSWRGTSFYTVSLADAAFNGEAEWQTGTYAFSSVDQARTMDAFLRASVSRSWVVGMMPFGYWNQEMPLAPDFSVRRAATEGVLEAWIAAQPP